MSEDDMEMPRRTLVIQVVVLFFIVLIITLLAIIFLPRTLSPGQHRITLRVEASSGSATIQYNAGTHIQKDPDLTFSTPWEKTWVLESGTEVVLTAGNHQQTGTIKCILRSDGVEWKSDTAKMPNDKVACAGIVR